MDIRHVTDDIAKLTLAGIRTGDRVLVGEERRLETYTGPQLQPGPGTVPRLWIGDREGDDLGGWYQPAGTIADRRRFLHANDSQVRWSTSAKRWEVVNGASVVVWYAAEDIANPWDVSQWISVTPGKAMIVVAREDRVTDPEDWVTALGGGGGGAWYEPWEHFGVIMRFDSEKTGAVSAQMIRSNPAQLLISVAKGISEEFMLPTLHSSFVPVRPSGKTGEFAIYAANRISFDSGYSAVIDYTPSPPISSFAAIDISGQEITKVRAKNVKGVGFTYNIYYGSAPFMNLSNNLLDKNAIDTLFEDLAPTSTATDAFPQINVTGNPGAATCDPTIATAKGYIVETGV